MVPAPRGLRGSCGEGDIEVITTPKCRSMMAIDARQANSEQSGSETAGKRSLKSKGALGCCEWYRGKDMEENEKLFRCDNHVLSERQGR